MPRSHYPWMTDEKAPPPPSARAIDAARAARAPAEPAGGGSVHEAMTREVRAIIADADLPEDEKQQILIALACPCCGAGGLSLRMKLGDGPVSF
jgi:hypothetical protein